MCGQRTDNIIYQDTFYHLATLPLDSYLKALKDPLEFQSPDTGLQRGYEGTWEIRDNLLLLVKLDGYFYNYRKVDIHCLFPGEDTVFANWYTGKLRIPFGFPIYQGGDYFQSIFDFELTIKIEKGHLVGTRMQNTMKKGRKKMLKEAELQRTYPF